MSTFQDTCDVVIEGGLVALLVFAPACLGAVHPMSFAVLQTGLFVLAFVWALKAGLHEMSGSRPGRRRMVEMGIAAFVIYGLVQWLSVASFLPTTASGYATRVALGKALTCGVAFLLVVGNLRRRDQLQRLMTAILCIGAVIALLALVQVLAPMESIYWWRKPEEGVRPFGPYLSREHFAGYMVMAIPLALCAVLAQRRTKRGSSGYWLTVLPGAATAVMLLALLFCRVPAGVVAFLASCLLLQGMILLEGKKSGRAKIIFGMVGAVGLIVLAWILAPVVLGDAVIGGDKASIWRSAVRMWLDSPVWGAGAGTFANVFPAYQNPSLGAADVTSASNELLQTLAEVGIVGLAVGAVFWGAWWVRCLRSWRAGEDSWERWMLAGGITSAGGMLVLSLLSSSLRVSANAFTFAVVLGIGYSLAETIRDSKPQEKRQPVEE